MQTCTIYAWLKRLFKLGTSEHVQYMYGIGGRNPISANVGGAKYVRYMHNTKIYPTSVQANMYIICMAQNLIQISRRRQRYTIHAQHKHSSTLGESKHEQYLHNIGSYPNSVDVNMHNICMVNANIHQKYQWHRTHYNLLVDDKYC